MNKVEKIKAEIERLKNELSDNKERLSLGEIIAVNNCYNNLIFFIDSLSDTEKDFSIKESVIPFGASDSELMEATYFIPQGYHAVIDGNKVIIKKGKEPVSNDLKEAAHFYVDTTIEWFDSEGNPCCYPAFIAGAQWQKEQMIDKACEWLKSYRQDTPDGTGYIPGIINDETIEDFKKAVEE